jgi:bifunctional non-homologous end joining protein LigD
VLVAGDLTMRTLEEYNHKRDFKKTLEPKGKKKKTQTKELLFVVQEHHASHLHYDFRLELDGVLKSWAVPKGPSVNPMEKRLAVQVEDHPVDYRNFEGFIPDNEYGGGEVLLWDTGTWVPEKDPHAAFLEGRLDFVLKGKRMKGRWTLVRSGLKGSKPNWFLFKRLDRFAGKDKLFHAIKKYGSKKERQKKITNISKTRLAFVAPQLSQLVEAPPVGKEWIHEIKFDGYRIQAHLQNGTAKLYTRSGHDWTQKYKVIAEQLETLKVSDAILDGEIVALDSKGRSDFQALQMALKAKKIDRLKYYVFDLMELNGKDLKKETLIERKNKLKKVLDSKVKNISYSEHLDADGSKLLHASCENDLEGIISKQKNALYRSGRSKFWLKSKCTKRQEFVVGGYTSPEGSRSRFGSLLLGVYENGKFKYVGRCGTGFNSRTLEMIWQKLKKLEVKRTSFRLAIPKEKDIHWVKPILVAEIAFANWTRENILRVPVFRGLRDDKTATEVKRELEDGAKALIVSQSDSVEITHPEKIIFPKDKVTKRDIANYYRAVAPWLLAEISDRPLSLKRCPNGTTNTCFFQKHFTERQRGNPSLPAVHEIMIQEHSGKKGYASVNTIEGVIALVQVGGFEIHAWGCRQPEIENPDVIVMDFDPNPDVSFAMVKKAAWELKALLDRLNLKSFLKVTGGKGLHVHIPIDPIYSWEDVKDFSKTLARHMEELAPNRYTTTLSKAARRGKIFIDYLRNGRSATAVAAYSLRTHEQSSVALPLSWDELKALKNPAVFTIKKALAHVRNRKSDPWKGASNLRQKIAILNIKTTNLPNHLEKVWPMEVRRSPEP